EEGDAGLGVWLGSGRPPETGQEPPDDFSVQLVACLGDRTVASDDAVESEDEGNGGGLLEAGAPADFGGERFAFRGRVGEPFGDEGVDIVGVDEGLEVADLVPGVVLGELDLLVPAAGS